MKNAIYTGAEIKYKAQVLGLKVSIVIPAVFSEIEYIAVEIESFKTAFFLMDNSTFKFSYSHTYDAMKDKTTKSTPKGF